MKLVLYFFVFCGLASCSHISGQKADLVNPELVFADAWGNMCFSAEGAGRARIDIQSGRFGFSSVLNPDKEIWKLGIDVMLHGEEIVELDYSKVYYHKIAYQLPSLNKMNDSVKDAMMEGLFKMGMFLKLYSVAPRIGVGDDWKCVVDGRSATEAWGQCHFQQQTSDTSFNWRVEEDKMSFVSLGKKFKFELNFREKRNKFFHLMELKVFEEEKLFLSLDLIPKECRI